jgi:UDP-2,4-diacetamido-2,4,6-trideoxy-beta-L-altropyranose hydrolase
MKSLIIRADASSEIGTGHIMRCLALAEAWQDCGGAVTFVLATSSSLLEERLSSETMKIKYLMSDPGSCTDAYETIRVAQDLEVKWIVVDGYHFGAEYQKIIKDSGLSLLFIDDYVHADHYYADIVINQNISAYLSLYKHYEPYTRFLLGTNYVLLRREFLKWVGYNRIIPEVARNVLVTFGGSDPENITLLVIEALKRIQINGLEVIAVIGGINQNYEILQQSVKDRNSFSIRKNVNNMPELMAWADFAISAGGTTCWELAFMGLPSLLYPIAENQKNNVRDLHSNGIVKCFEIEEILNLESSRQIITDLLISYEERASLYKNMEELVDGDGTRRIINLISAHPIQLRNVKESDCDLVYSWINDPFVRTNSFNPEKISWEEHENWFSSIISDPDTIYYIALDIQENPVGQARFKIESDEAIISVLLGTDQRGKNLGSELIRYATKRCFNETDIKKINAYIKLENNTSLNSFLKAGYKQMKIITEEDQGIFHLIKIRGEK